MNARVIPITVFVCAADVERAVGCSRSAAYDHLRRASGRAPGARGMLRVSIATWESYAEKTWGTEVRAVGSSDVVASGTRTFTPTKTAKGGASKSPRGALIAQPRRPSIANSNGMPPIPITRPPTARP